VSPIVRCTLTGKRSGLEAAGAWVGIATLTGLPAMTAPIGRSDDGLPIGVQIVGGYLDDRTTITFAGPIECEFGGFVSPPLD
jgi:amidase